MTAKKGSNKDDKPNNGAWWNSIDFYAEIEGNSIRAIENQKEWIEGSKEYVAQLEENANKLTTEWTTNAEKFATENRKGQEAKDYQEWFKKLEEIGHNSNRIAFLPGKSTLDILSKSTEQYEEAFIKASEQNKKIREETTKAIEGFIEQMKESQKDMFQLFPFNPLTPNK